MQLQPINDGRSTAPDFRQDLLAFAEDGTDLTLIRWMLSLTPGERLQVAQQYANAIARFRNANL